MVFTRKNQLDGFAAEYQLHSIGVHDIGAAHLRVILCRRHVAIVVPVVALKETRGHSADSRMRHSRPDDFFELELPVIVAVDHIARHMRVSAIHIPQYTFLRNDFCGIAERSRAFNVIKMAGVCNRAARDRGERGTSQQQMLALFCRHTSRSITRRSMKKQFMLTRSGLSGIVVGVLIVGLAVGFAAQGGQRGPATPAAPCGPSIAGELGANTAKSSRCFELRMYTVDTSKSRINDLHKRFRDGEVDIFKKNGMEVLGVWQSLDDPNTLVYLLAHKDRASRDASWAAFQADPKWIELRTKYPITLTPKIFMLSAADYSPLK